MADLQEMMRKKAGDTVYNLGHISHTYGVLSCCSLFTSGIFALAGWYSLQSTKEAEKLLSSLEDFPQPVNIKSLYDLQKTVPSSGVPGLDDIVSTMIITYPRRSQEDLQSGLQEIEEKTNSYVTHAKMAGYELSLVSAIAFTYAISSFRSAMHKRKKARKLKEASDSELSVMMGEASQVIPHSFGQLLVRDYYSRVEGKAGAALSSLMTLVLSYESIQYLLERDATAFSFLGMTALAAYLTKQQYNHIIKGY